MSKSNHGWTCSVGYGRDVDMFYIIVGKVVKKEI